MVQQPLDRVRCGPVKFLCTTLAPRSMPIQSILWDLDDDPNGNVQHCAQHCVTKTDVEEVLQNAEDADFSRTTGRPVVFGDTNNGRHLMVVYEKVDADTIYPITAYDVTQRQRA